MNSEDRELRDDRLAARLRESLGRQQAPEAWVQEALAVSRRSGKAPAARPGGAIRSAEVPRPPAPAARVPWLVALFPHLAGLALLGPLVFTWILRPELIRGALEPATRLLDQASTTGGPGFWTLAGILVPLMVLFIEQGARGFPILRRLGIRH